MNAPNEKAMNIACRRRSSVRLPTESLMISKLARVDGQAIQHDRREDDPGDRKHPVRRPVDRRDDRHLHRHAVADERHGEGRDQRRQRRHPCWFAQHAEHEEEDENRNGGHDRRHTQTPAYRFIVVLPHSSLAARASKNASRCVRRSAGRTRRGPTLSEVSTGLIASGPALYT
jgi:hypothetical protein